MTVEEKVIVILRRVLDGSTTKSVGLCAIIRPLGVDNHYPTKWAVSNLMTKWPEYSGNESYPVPAPKDWWGSAEDAYDNLDLYEGEYGASRLRLAEWLIEQLESGVKLS